MRRLLWLLAAHTAVNAALLRRPRPAALTEQVSVLRAWIDQGAKWPDEITFKKAPILNLHPRQVELPPADASVGEKSDKGPVLGGVRPMLPVRAVCDVVVLCPWVRSTRVIVSTSPTAPARAPLVSGVKPCEAWKIDPFAGGAGGATGSTG